MPPPGLRGISRDFSRLSPCGGQVAYVLLTRAPVAARSQQADSRAAPRLACVKPVASVHPEPGSNSSLLYLVFFFSLFVVTLRLTAFTRKVRAAPRDTAEYVCPIGQESFAYRVNLCVNLSRVSLKH